MGKLNEEKAIAVLLANLKGPKNKPSKVSELAVACRLLKHSSDWGFVRMSDFFQVSRTMLREIDKINELEPEFKRLADEKKIGIGAAYQLTRIDKSKRHEVAQLFQSMNTTEIRNLVFYLINDPALSVSEAKRMSDELKTPVLNILALPISDELKTKIERVAKGNGQSIHEYVVRVLEEHCSS